MGGNPRTMTLQKILPLILRLAFALALALACFREGTSAQSARGTIDGRVTADQGSVIAFRVAAHNLDLRLWYTVFTSKGRYTVPQALPGRYEITVFEPAYDSSKPQVDLAAGQSKTVDLAITKRAASPLAGGDSVDAPASSGKVEYVSRIEDMFPPGPGLDRLKQDCTGCHFETFNGFGAMHYTRERFLQSIEMMTETGPGYNPFVLALGRTPIGKQEKNVMADYLVKNFGPGTTEKRLRIDPLVLDEDVASKAIYVSYDVPADLPLISRGNIVGADMVDGVIPQVPPIKFHHLQAAFVSPVDGSIWFSSHSNSLLRLDSKSLDPVARWKNYPIKGDPFVQPSGVAIDKQGRVYWAELKAGLIGELDPATGRQIRHALPMQAGAIEEVVVDKDGNVGFGLIWGSLFGRMDAVTRKIHMYPTPTPDNGIYGLVVDQHGNLWGGGWQKGDILKWDADTETVKEYKVPNSWGEVRRIGVDSKGIVWASEYPSGIIASLDPSTGELSEYKIPLSGAKPYEAWADKLDNVWTSDQMHSAMIMIDHRTRKFSFYPMPQANQSVPKIQVAADNTIWFGTRNLPIATAVHFYPNGYTAEAHPLP
jgi:streptogramin lyase